MARVYIETTIPSFYYESRRETRIAAWREATREWWDRHRDAYEVVTSEIVVQELRQAPGEKAEQMLRLLDGVPRLPAVPGIEDVARYYLEHRLMPESAEPDAFHVAIATMHNVEFLLTWNIRHLANANKTRHLTVLNNRLGLPVPIITTPDMLTPENDR